MSAVYAVGDRVAVVRSGGRIDFRAGRTGRVLAQAHAATGDYQRYEATTWQDKPALLSWIQKTTPSNGLSQERKEQLVEAFDNTGHRLGGARWPKGAEEALVNGYLITNTDSSPPSVTVTPASGGGPHRRVSCSDDSCGFDFTPDGPVTMIDSSESPTPVLLGHVLFAHRRLTGNDQIANAVVATDVRTGRTLWSSDRIRRPAGAIATAELADIQVVPMGLAGDRMVLAWVRADDHWIIAEHQIATGALAVTGPTLPDGPDRLVVDPTTGRAAVAVGTLDPRTTMWDLRTGRTRWINRENEQTLAPTLLYGTVLLAYRSVLNDGELERPILLDARSKRVLATDDQVNTTLSVGTAGVVTVLDHAHVFAFALAGR